MREPTVFELIVAGKLPCNKVLENDDFLAFHDINPQAPVHILVIPKTHCLNFHQYDSAKMAAMSDFIKEIAKMMGLDKSGYRLVTNIGEDSGQEVPHLHFHILGGTKLSAKHVQDADPKGTF